MDILINPTNKCNFACTFCSASNISKGELTAADTIELLKPYSSNLQRLIFNGGDPLMMSPKYYYDILSWTEKEIDHPVYLSLTTNLWDFYLNPDKWSKLFKNKRVGITTSFQYGEGRKVISKDRIAIPYTEHMFKNVMYAFKMTTGYYPTFIYVADEDNEMYIDKALQLAKLYGIRCRINKKVSLGRAENQYYPRYRMYEKYIDIINSGMINYEFNCCTTIKHMANNKDYPCCDYDRNCHEHMIVINPDKTITSCCFLSQYVNDDNRYKYDIMIDPKNKTTFAKENHSIKEECFGCENFKICNSCRTYIKEVKDNNDEDNYCNHMRSLLPELKKVVLDHIDEITYREY